MNRVYDVCMARVNIYLPDDLASRAREAGLNVSAVAQEALERELRIRDLDTWLDEVRALPPLGGTHADTIADLDAVRAEAGDDFPPGYDMSNP
jgi:post-segregation antitoxin (ccd killing protein)